MVRKETCVPRLGSYVTLGVCVRNCEKYLRDAIKSITEQDYPHDFMEIIFVDDGSEDGTLSIIKDFVPKIDVNARVFSAPWRGLGHARNIVAAHAKGDFILWVDGDMVLAKEFVRKLVEFMEENPDVGIAKGKQALLPGGNLLATLETFARAAGRMLNYRSERARFKSLGTGGAIYRVEAIREAGGFDENIRGYCEDQDIEIRIRAHGWSLDTVEAMFRDYERHELTWKKLWGRYWLRGYHTYYFVQKNKGVIKHYYMFPPLAFLSGLLQSFMLYKLTFRKLVFLLPFQYVFKMTAWYVGFVKSHLNSYDPTNHVCVSTD
jgi:glycosyltransferase involved in cell wall biosynthesis